MSREDYIEVSERIQRFYEKYPDGSLQGSWEWLDDAHNVIVYRAEAYRTADDIRPGVGYASEPYPGLSNFTRGSEIMNAETSAWGRAIASQGIAVHRGIASAQEVRAAQRGTDVTPVRRSTVTEPDDPWYTGTTTPRVDEGPSAGQMTYAKKEPATDKQLKMIVAKLKGMGMGGPDNILNYVNAVMAENGLEQVAGSEALTKYTASKVIDALMANPAATPP
ncbi:hypothetical protein UFOVP1214_7 [uncultured Caudovirales phage]|uniref:Uncharacterized protein n=1 Tax=uncultured Caudovirales phage TaxID=2100421 RepID=A0A6J5R2H7_9CAUD|nr:hypothetical protein UFOVP1046_18 [uncultured Caudovirales phage]CAB4190943.1 hypothetical protein UFOVP1214_7 [uncultured Caudovirales phage]